MFGVLSHLVPPDDVKPIFLSAPTQNIFGVVTDQDVTVEEPFKLLTKQAILDDMVKRAAVSDFSVVKQIIQVRSLLFRPYIRPFETNSAML